MWLTNLQLIHMPTNQSTQHSGLFTLALLLHFHEPLLGNRRKLFVTLDLFL
jgi:hypothetical protein